MSALTDSERKMCIEMFDSCDQDCSGTLTYDEIVKCVKSLGWEDDAETSEKIKKWFTELSFNRETGINQSQFLRAYGQSYLKDRRLAQLTKVFKDLDDDKSGTLSVDELYSGLEGTDFPFYKDELEVVLQQMGSENGQFNISDFVNYFRTSGYFNK